MKKQIILEYNMRKAIAGLLLIITAFTFSSKDFDPENDITLKNFFEKELNIENDNFKMIVSIEVPEG